MSSATSFASDITRIISDGPDDVRPMPGAVGITTFIKTELIADGVGRACVPRPGGLKNGVKIGQKVDNDLYQHIRHRRPLKEPAAMAVMKALRLSGLTPILAQVRANNRDLRLTTLVDLLCVKAKDLTLWAVEVKNTTLPKKSHIQSYTRQCSKTPWMKNTVSHTELNTHALQAAFGAMALEKTYKKLPKIKSMVVVATRGAEIATIYTLSNKLHNWNFFKRRKIVPLNLTAKESKKKDSKSIPKKTNALPSLIWPPDNPSPDLALKNLQLMRLDKSKRKRAVFPIFKKKISGKRKANILPVGLAICTPTRFSNCNYQTQKHILNTMRRAGKSLFKKSPELQKSGLSLLGIALDTLSVVTCAKPMKF